MLLASAGEVSGSLVTVVVGVCLAAVLAAFGFLIRQWIAGLSDDLHSMIRLVDELADRMRSQGERITRMETVVAMIDETPSRVRRYLQRQEGPADSKER